jgi:heptosyltransferase-2
LYGREPSANEVLIAPETWRGRVRLARELRERRFDTAILLPNSFETALVARMGGIPRRIGYNRDGRGFLLTDPVAPPNPGEIPAHERFYYLELLRRAGLIAELPPEQPIQLHAADEARCAGLELFRAMGFQQPVVGVSPGAQNSRAKQWLPERFVESALRLVDALNGGVALFGSRSERPLCQAMAEEIRRAGRLVLNLAGETTLVQFIELAAACRVFLTNDSGAMHVASTLAVPTVAVFGPTEYFATAPAGSRSVIVREQVDCSPCMLRDCPIDHRCMTAISAERVAETALELLK